MLHRPRQHHRLRVIRGLNALAAVEFACFIQSVEPIGRHSHCPAVKKWRRSLDRGFSMANGLPGTTSSALRRAAADPARWQEIRTIAPRARATRPSRNRRLRLPRRAPRPHGYGNNSAVRRKLRRFLIQQAGARRIVSQAPACFGLGAAISLCSLVACNLQSTPWMACRLFSMHSRDAKLGVSGRASCCRVLKGTIAPSSCRHCATERRARSRLH